MEQPIAGDELRAIKRHLAARTDALPWLFISERSQPLTHQAVNYLIGAAAKRAGLPGVHPHTLRHSCGFVLADKGYDLRLIQTTWVIAIPGAPSTTPALQAGASKGYGGDCGSRAKRGRMPIDVYTFRSGAFARNCDSVVCIGARKQLEGLLSTELLSVALARAFAQAREGMTISRDWGRRTEEKCKRPSCSARERRSGTPGNCRRSRRMNTQGKDEGSADNPGLPVTARSYKVCQTLLGINVDSSFLSVTEAAVLLGVSTATLRNWDRQGKLTARRHPVNKYRMYARHELDALAVQTSLFQAEQPPLEGRIASDARALRRLVSRLHNVLRDNDSQSNIVLRFDEITKLIFTKVMSDRLAGAEGSPLSRALGDPNAIRGCYARLAAEHRSLIPAAFASLKCSDLAVRQCVEALEMVDFSQSDFDVKGLAYEEVIRNTFDKSDHQQFFTPPQVVEFMVSACETDLKGSVCDPACGTGGFLASIARRGLPYESLTGMEIDERLAWVAGMNMFLHGAHNFDTVLLPDGGTLGRMAQTYFGRFDVILTNPPFGSDLADPELLGHMKLGAGRPSRRRGILFIERCWDLLKSGGTLAIVIDEGVLNLPHAEDVRSFILKNFDIAAVVSLPESTFQPYATVNASIMLLRKRCGSETCV